MIPSLPFFSAEELLALTDPLTVERGQQYFLDNRVLQLMRQGTRFRATVQGSTRYQVYLWTLPLSGSCNCPFPGPGACKHIIATGMAILAGSPPATLVPELSFAGADPLVPFQYISHVNPEQVAQSLRAGKYSLTDWEQRFRLASISHQPIEMMDLLLGRFEFTREVTPELEQNWLEYLRDHPPHPLRAREMGVHFFERWYLAERKAEINGGLNPYSILEWMEMLLPLLEGVVPAQYVRIQLEGYGLYSGIWERLWGVIRTK